MTPEEHDCESQNSNASSKATIGPLVQESTTTASQRRKLDADGDERATSGLCSRTSVHEELAVDIAAAAHGGSHDGADEPPRPVHQHGARGLERTPGRF
jgi:hypothetical protein